MKIGELSAKTGCAPSAIRFYEERGILTGVRRGPGGQRVYDASAVDRLNFVMRCRMNGMKLSCIERILGYEALKEDPLGDRRAMTEQIRSYLEDARRMKAELERLEDYLASLMDELEPSNGCSKPDAHGRDKTQR